METQIEFLVALFFPLALGVGIGLFIIAAIEAFFRLITDLFNG